MNAVIQGKTKLPSMINILLVVALGVLASKLMWLIVTPENKLNYELEEVGVVTGSVKKEINYGKLIAKQHLFGEIRKKNKVVTEPKTVTKKPVITATKLNLKLHGIVAYNKNEGFALISSKNGPQKVYGEGEEIQKGVKVSKIYPDKVVLLNHGKSEDLRLPVNKNKLSTRPVGKPPIQSSFANSYKGNVPGNKSKVPQPAKTKKATQGLNLGAFRKEVLANPGKMMDVARPSPAVVNGEFIGFRVQPGTKRKLFRKLGFRPNDIITEVNGIRLDSPNKGAMVLGELSQASSLSVKVKRGNQDIFIDESF